MQKKNPERELSRLDWIKQHLHDASLADLFDARVFGFACTLAWTYVLLFSTTIHFSTRNDISHFNSVFGFSCLGMVIVLLAGALFPKQFTKAMRHISLRSLAPVVMSITTLILVVVDIDVIRQPWCSIAATASGMGVGIMYLAWGEVFKRLSSERTILKTAASFFLAALLFACIVALPRGAGIAITTVLPLIVGFILFKMLAIWEKPALLASIQVKRVAFSIRAILSLGVLSLTESLMRALFFNAMPIISEGSYPWLFLIATIMSIGIVCITLFSAKGLNYGFAYRAIVFVLAFIFLLLPIFNLGSFVADVLALTAYCAITMLIWIILAKMTGLYQLSALFVFGIGWGAHMVGTFAGMLGGALLGSYIELTPRLLSAIALACVCLMFFAYVFIFNERSILRLTGELAEDNPQHLRFRYRCEQVAQEYGLTKRETEVMVLFAKGRSAPRIQEELDLTLGTINTHMSHIYKKLDVHDKQEMIDLLEGSLERPNESS